MTGTVLLRRVVLTILVCVAGARLFGFVARFGRESLQLDFAAFYTAGEARAHGLSPYQTYPDREPPIWDGSDVFRHSRFLYPPLAATWFRPLAALPYAVAKWVWMLGIVACLVLALRETLLTLSLRLSVERALAVALFVATFHPLLTLLERGQVDALTLLLIAAALRPLVSDGRQTVASGFLLALATVLKLNVGFLVPLLVLRRKFRVVLAYAASGLILLGVSLVLDGPALWSDYVVREMPRISRFGERGTDDMRLDPEVLDRLRNGAPEGLTIRQGHTYRLESFGYVANASLAWIVSRRGGETPARAALVLLAVLVAVMACRPWRNGPSPGDPVGELAYWQAVMAGILLCGPLTWAMNVVWLLPVGLTLIAARGQRSPAASHDLSGLAALPDEPRQAPHRREPWAWSAVALGLFLAWMPDHHTLPFLVRYGAFLNQKYVLAELLVLGGLLVVLARRSGAAWLNHSEILVHVAASAYERNAVHDHVRQRH